MRFYEILCPRSSPAPEDSSCTVIQGYFSVVSRRFYPSELYIMSESLLSYLRIDTLSPSAPTSSLCRSRQDAGSRGHVSAGAGRLREGVGTRSQVDAAHSQQLGYSLCRSRQDAGSRSHVSAGARRQREFVKIKKR